MMFNPERIIISRHAIERYQQRRSRLSDAEAEAAIRSLLRRVCHQCPPIAFRAGYEHAVRRYRQGGLDFVVTADGQRLLTLYHNSSVTGRARQRRKRARAGAA